ncbi:QacE family quaternary ammonium compound efflux SMR transporter [Halobacillus litoralis]|uniref:QacE family quaternary ammonium compound efflux SMR transporter n=1 Tax=Halobacillus litoralis TaxID=45668 RepID=A0A845DXS8_9BACI|nr:MULTISPECIES: multidrug efflux SMR transporter [Halobacillus]MCA1024089.1 multidrug efflux SMR transporter [Halobacillus litoralis]MYL21265.1 QacE family quaternary ammonium compound efflux SMR transporter [Halobacillus litoralis]MYL30290.1 QacE family quaternary ammonium compound efflux SMR transporter [Halobacillus halophilus]MYL38282.1 QacE family quaternary ammonium compound efflux SMR transporter [Halobacillus litoralis]
MAWIFLVLAGTGEMTSMFFLKLSEGFKKKLPTIGAAIAMSGSLYFLSLSLNHLPIGTAYAIWTGIGSAGTVLLGILFFNEKATPKRMLFIACILTGIIGLKLVS